MIHALRLMGEVFQRFRWRLVRDTTLLALEGVLGVAAILTVAPVIDTFFSSAPGQSSLITTRVAAGMRAIGWPVSLGGFLALFLLVQALKNGFGIGVRFCLLRTRYAVLRELMLGTFRDVLHARWQFFTSSQQGTLLNTFLYEMTTFSAALGVITLLFAQLIQLLFYMAVPFVISWPVATVSLGAALLFAAPFVLLGRANYRWGKQGTATTNQISAVVQESLSLAKIILGFGRQAQRVRELERAFDAHRRVACRFLTLQAATPLVYEPLGILVLIVAIFAGRRVGVPLSEVAVMLWALRNCMPLLGTILTQKNALLHFTPSYEQIRRIREQARALQQPSGGRPFAGFQTGLEVERVTFSYPGHEPALRDLSFTIPKGKMVALVGASGAGKSTLIDLLMGFHAASAGRITIDGVPLEEFDLTSYRERIGYVPQDSVLFNCSIRENLRWADETATDEAIRQACREANAEEFIERFPEGYDTMVGDRGVRLSGGQCQRLALARAILRKPDLLILDEATSSLDTQSERLIQQAIEAVARETTVVVIAHRLSTIVNADEIYVLDQGRIVEAGTYHALIQRNGPFSRMTQMQVLEPVA